MPPKAFRVTSLTENARLSATYGTISGPAPRKKRRQAPASGLAGPYQPVSEGVPTLSPPGAQWPIIVPDSMDTETNSALRKLRDALGGDVSWFVQQRCGYPTIQELGAALTAEQVDAVALAIYNFEARNEGIIIADQTGIGKGRIGAALIRYAHKQGLLPIFLTEKANLFSDIYRDLSDIGSGQLRPFIVNARDDKSAVKGADGSVRYQAAPPAQQKATITQWSKRLFNDSDARPALRDEDGRKCDVVLATYSQFNTGFDWESPINIKRGGKLVKPNFDLLPPKCQFLVNLVQGQILILDESHNASGESNTGAFLGKVLARAKAVGFLSATFAKRPDNMVVYAGKTVLQEAQLPASKLVQAIVKGGVSLQEIISSQLVGGGQLLRRERPYAGVEINWIPLTAQATVHRARVDAMTAILRDIIDFQLDFVNPTLELLSEDSGGQKISKTKGTDEGGVNNVPMFSRVFNLMFQLLFTIKVEAMAAHAIERLRQGKKVLIAFQSTMGAFMEHTRAEHAYGEDEAGDDQETGLDMQADTRVKATFDVVLERMLTMALAYSVEDSNGKKHRHVLRPAQLVGAGEAAHAALSKRISEMSVDVNVSPIDLLTKLIQEAGFSVAEVTGRTLYLDLADDNATGVVRRRTRENTSDAFRRFNNNKADCLLLNAAGSTGASAHAVATATVPAHEVLQRYMLIGQPNLNINTEVQMRGRIFRTAQLLAPGYDYVFSLVPAEQRMMLMMKRKLKSLDANTTSNQKNSAQIVDNEEFADFLNHHGDLIAAEYLLENERMNLALGGALAKYDVKVAIGDDGEKSIKQAPADFALKVSGRVAVLSCKQQLTFYTEISERYKSHLAYLNEIGQNDLEVKDMDLRAVVQERTPKLLGQGGRSAFGGSVYLEKATVRNLSKPMSAVDLSTLLRNELDGRTPEQAQQELMTKLEQFFVTRIEAYNGGYDWEAAIDRELLRRKISKGLKRSDPNGYADIVALIRTDLEIKLAADVHAIQRQARFIQSVFKRFKIGYGYKVPNPDLTKHENSDDYLPAAFLGFALDEERPNPYTLSEVKLRFAVATPQRSLTLPVGSPLGKTAFYASANQYSPWNGYVSAGTWTELISRANADTETRYFLTGNVLLALGNDLFKEWRLSLVSFTMADGTVRKGILMPRRYNDQVISEAKAGQRGMVIQSLAAAGLATRLAEIRTAQLRGGQHASNLHLSTAGGTGIVTIRKGESAAFQPTFTLWLGWREKFDNEAKALVKSGSLLLALSQAYELSKTKGSASTEDRRFQSENVPLERLAKVLVALGKEGCNVQLSGQMLEDYPDLLPENRDYDSDTWPAPPNMPRPRPEALEPWVSPTAAPPAVVSDRARKLKLAQAKVKIAAAARARAQEQGVLAGPVRGRVGHSRIRSFV